MEKKQQKSNSDTASAPVWKKALWALGQQVQQDASAVQNPFSALLHLEAALVQVWGAFVREHASVQKQIKKALSAQKSADQVHDNWPPYNRSGNIELMRPMEQGYWNLPKEDQQALGEVCALWEDKKHWEVCRALVTWCSVVWRADAPQDAKMYPTAKRWQRLQQEVSECVKAFIDEGTLVQALDKNADDWRAVCQGISKASQSGHYYDASMISKSVERIGVMMLMAGLAPWKELSKADGTDRQSELVHSTRTVMRSMSGKSSWLLSAWGAPVGHMHHTGDWLESLGAYAQTLLQTGVDAQSAWSQACDTYAKAYPAVTLMQINMGNTTVSWDDTRQDAQVQNTVRFGSLAEWLVNRADRTGLYVLYDWAMQTQGADALHMHTDVGDFSLYVPSEKKAPVKKTWEAFLIDNAPVWSQNAKAFEALEKALLNGSERVAQALYDADKDMPARCLEFSTRRYVKKSKNIWIAEVLSRGGFEEGQKWMQFLEKNDLLKPIKRKQDRLYLAYGCAHMAYDARGHELVKKYSQNVDVSERWQWQSKDKTVQCTVSATALLQGLSVKEHQAVYGTAVDPTVLWDTHTYTSDKNADPVSVMEALIDKHNGVYYEIANCRYHWLDNPKYQEGLAQAEQKLQLGAQHVLEVWQQAQKASGIELQKALGVLCASAKGKMGTVFEQVLDTVVQLEGGREQVQQQLRELLKDMCFYEYASDKAQHQVRCMVRALNNMGVQWERVDEHGEVLVHVLWETMPEQEWDIEAKKLPAGAGRVWGLVEVVLDELAHLGVSMDPHAGSARGLKKSDFKDNVWAKKQYLESIVESVKIQNKVGEKAVKAVQTGDKAKQKILRL